MNHKDIYYLLGKCLILDDQPKLIPSVLEAIGSETFPWELFVQTGSDHLVLPAVFKRFADAELLHHFPEDLGVHLKEIFDLNQNRNARILSQARRINGVLASAGIQPILIKGAGALAENLYSHPAERMMADIDLLIPMNNTEEAAGILMKDGFSSDNSGVANQPVMHHLPTLIKCGEVNIDLHIEPVTPRYSHYVRGWEKRSVVRKELQHQDLHLLSLMDKVVLNFLHSQFQNRGQYFARVPLREAYEAYKLLSLEDVSEEINLTIGNLQGPFNNYMVMVSRLFNPFRAGSTMNTFQSKFYVIRLDRNKTSRSYYRSSKIIRTVVLQLAYYLQVIFRATHRKEYRQYLISRIRNPAFYRKHVRTVRRRLK